MTLMTLSIFMLVCTKFEDVTRICIQYIAEGRSAHTNREQYEQYNSVPRDFEAASRVYC